MRKLTRLVLSVPLLAASYSASAQVPGLALPNLTSLTSLLSVTSVPGLSSLSVLPSTTSVPGLSSFSSLLSLTSLSGASGLPGLSSLSLLPGTSTVPGLSSLTSLLTLTSLPGGSSALNVGSLTALATPLISVLNSEPALSQPLIYSLGGSSSPLAAALTIDGISLTAFGLAPTLEGFLNTFPVLVADSPVFLTSLGALGGALSSAAP